LISRVAESCFWLQRHVERWDSMARLLEVRNALLLDVALPAGERWRPLLVVAGEEPRFVELHGARRSDNGELVQRYLTWDETNPVSVFSSARWARENARTIRETLSVEAWEAINSFWLWLRDGKARRLYDNDHDSFFARAREAAQLFRGVCQDTMLHETPFDFLRLGLSLERAGQTARVLDVKYHQMGTRADGAYESVDELILWESVLTSLNAAEAFQKRGYALEGRQVARFLLLEAAHPRSILHNVERAWNFLHRVRPIRGRGYATARRLRELRDEIRRLQIEEVLDNEGLHEYLTSVVESLAEVGELLQREFFDAPPGAEASP
jgi:uncharacterized alpha-E superfamily protein